MKELLEVNNKKGNSVYWGTIAWRQRRGSSSSAAVVAAAAAQQ
jgi:hypothetical protein